MTVLRQPARYAEKPARAAGVSVQTELFHHGRFASSRRSSPAVRAHQPHCDPRSAPQRRRPRLHWVRDPHPSLTPCRPGEAPSLSDAGQPAAAGRGRPADPGLGAAGPGTSWGGGSPVDPRWEQRWGSSGDVGAGRRSRGGVKVEGGSGSPEAPRAGNSTEAGVWPGSVPWLVSPPFPPNEKE